MLDFTSSCYLGIEYSSQTIQPWSQLTTGKPAALYEPKAYRRVAQKVANLQGLETGAIAKSTLHLFWDLFGILSQENFIAFVDSQTYSIAQWGLERFACKGNEVFKFKHHYPGHLHKVLKSRVSIGKRPLIVTDGWCTHCGKMAPLDAYLECARAYNGILIVDDTQALGIFGTSPSHASPYGLWGGGSLQYLGLNGSDIILISSLAKAFGVPIAIISGSESMIDRFNDLSDTRVHCSPPSYADIYAADYTLHRNRKIGDRSRQKLFKLVHRFKQKLSKIEIQTKGGLFPVQRLVMPLQINIRVEEIHVTLEESGISTLLVAHNQSNQEPEILFILTANHTLEDVDLAVEVLETLKM